ncbi:hypothetical protein MRX96_031977 [Rhipicephalus microplus]
MEQVCYLAILISAFAGEDHKTWRSAGLSLSLDDRPMEKKEARVNGNYINGTGAKKTMKRLARHRRPRLACAARPDET